MSTTIEEDYIEHLSNEILDWCETLIGKGRLDFKQSECKEKFVVVMEAKVIKACELLCTKGQLHQDPSSRRIIIYKIAADFVSKTEEKLAKKASSAPAPAPAKKAPSSKADKPVESVLKPVADSKKHKATEQAGAGSKKQKLSDVSGVKKISSYFTAQPKASAAPPVKKSNDEDGENTEPHASSVNTSVSSQSTQNSHTSHASHASRTTHTSGTTKTAPAPAPKPMFKITVEEFSPFKPEPEYTEEASTEGTINEELITQVCKLILAETERRQAADEAECLLVAELLGQLGEGAREEELRAVLQRLEGQNKIMVDVDTIYVV